jgi:dTDP-4-amino-4,6-dideoxygalactose transaminase
MQSIELIDFHKQYAPLKEEILARISRALDNIHNSDGENIQALENDFARFCGTTYCVAVSNRTSALYIILRALKIGPGDEVITVSHTFIGTIEAILLAGARPVFVDINPHTYLMNVEQVEGKINPRTRAILPVHMYGQITDMDILLDIATRRQLYIIEDACQAHGAEYRSFRAGSLGDAAVFSFYCSQSLVDCGEGGFITTNNVEIARRARMMRDHGPEICDRYDLVGYHARLDEFRTLIAQAKLPCMEGWIERRRACAGLYQHLLTGLPLVLPVEAAHNKHVYIMYVIRTPQRNDLCTFLKDYGISTGIYYPIPAHLQRVTSSLGYHAGDLPVTERVAGEILSLPMYAELEDQQITYVVQMIREFLQAQQTGG